MLDKLFVPTIFKPFVRTFDVLFASLIAGPLVVVYWLSTWKLCDSFIRPDNPTISAVISFVIGLCGQLIVMFYQAEIGKLLTFEKLKFVNLMLTKGFALVLALTCILLWRGVWMFLDLISANDNFSMTCNVVLNLVILMVTKTIRNSSSTPFVVTTDQFDNEYQISTYFKRVVSDLGKHHMTLNSRLTFK